MAASMPKKEWLTKMLAARQAHSEHGTDYPADLLKDLMAFPSRRQMLDQVIQQAAAIPVAPERLIEALDSADEAEPAQFARQARRRLDTAGHALASGGAAEAAEATGDRKGDGNDMGKAAGSDDDMSEEIGRLTEVEIKTRRLQIQVHGLQGVLQKLDNAHAGVLLLRPRERGIKQFLDEAESIVKKLSPNDFSKAWTGGSYVLVEPKIWSENRNLQNKLRDLAKNTDLKVVITGGQMKKLVDTIPQACYSGLQQAGVDRAHIKTHWAHSVQNPNFSVLVKDAVAVTGLFDASEAIMSACVRDANGAGFNGKAIMAFLQDRLKDTPFFFDTEFLTQEKPLQAAGKPPRGR